MSQDRPDRHTEVVVILIRLLRPSSCAARSPRREEAAGEGTTLVRYSSGVQGSALMRAGLLCLRSRLEAGAKVRR